MGEQRVSKLSDKKKMQAFIRSLLKDVRALEHMLQNEMFDTGITRIGAEQEMVMVDKKSFKPACIAVNALKLMKDYDWVETELAKFNLETNLEPRELKTNCFSLLEKENSQKLDAIQEKLDELDAQYVLTGILPTLRKYHMTLSNLTPKKRYHALMEAVKEQQLGQAFELRLVGIDELLVKHDSPMLEAVNTSFQVHLQIEPDDFANYYNIAQAITGPMIAIAANSPLVFGKRLWHESRIALFQQSLDTRSTHEHMRERSARVSFGNDWLNESVLEIFKEDITRFRVLISSDVKEDSMKMLANGKIPKLRSLQVHNSTVYRWNRPCYGISENGKPHLRIENRVLASGPTVVDEVANSALWIGAMIHYGENIGDIRDKLSFADVRDNFGKATRFGLDCQFNWFKEKKISASELILKHLAPAARKGLASRKVHKRDIDKYIGIIEARAKAHMTGARWMLRAFTNLSETTTLDETLSILTATIIKNQKKNKPIHTWPMPKPTTLKEYEPVELKVSDFMITDLVTVHKDDILEMVAEIMNWKDIHFMPVEDVKGNLEGLITSKMIMKNLSGDKKSRKKLTANDVMITSFETVTPDTTVKKAIKIMMKGDLRCLPVVSRRELIGIITEKQFLNITKRII